MAINQDSRSRQDEVSRLIQEGRRPEDLQGRMDVFRDKLAGNVPLGVDAPNKSARKAIGGSGELFVVLKYGFFGLFAAVCGVLFVWAGLNPPSDMKTVGIGVAVLALATFLLLRALRAWRMLKSIARA